MNYYTSDLHFDHTNVIKYDKRPFNNVDEMNNEIVKRINEKCSSNDNLYILGDIALKYSKNIVRLLKQLNPRLHLIVGNHDRVFLKYMNIQERDFIFIEVKEYLRIKDNNKDVILFHYPIFNWDNQKNNSIHLYGHVHNKEQFQLNVKNSFNVGCMMHDYYPVSLEELLQKDDILNLKINKNA